MSQFSFGQPINLGVDNAWEWFKDPRFSNIFQSIQTMGNVFRRQAAKRRTEAIDIFERGVETDTQQMKQAALMRSIGSGLATSSAVQTQGKIQARQRTSMRAQLAGLRAAPPQQEADPFFLSMLQAWLGRQSALSAKGTRPKSSSGSSAMFGALGALGGGLLGGPFGAALGGAIFGPQGPVTGDEG